MYTTTDNLNLLIWYILWVWIGRVVSYRYNLELRRGANTHLPRPQNIQHTVVIITSSMHGGKYHETWWVKLKWNPGEQSNVIMFLRKFWFLTYYRYLRQRITYLQITRQPQVYHHQNQPPYPPFHLPLRSSPPQYIAWFNDSQSHGKSCSTERSSSQEKQDKEIRGICVLCSWQVTAE